MVVDIDGQPATGLVRLARKILHSSATSMARSATYSFASFGIKRSGASGGINAQGDEIESALASFLSEIEPSVKAGDLHLDPAKGIPSGAFSNLQEMSGRRTEGLQPDNQAEGVVAATRWALGGDLDGRSVAIEGATHGAVPRAIATKLIQQGATIVEVDGLDEKPWLIWGAQADAIVCGSKLGVLNHAGTRFIKAKAIVPWATTPVTTKAFANLQRANVRVIPDFVSAAGSLVGGYIGPKDPSVSDQIVTILSESDEHPDGVLLGACYRAESFLGSWIDKLPFGRPLAS